MLGNIVAVTSIIAVVSLIQGMNAYVTDAILSDVGADTFQVQRYPRRPGATRNSTRPEQPARLTLDDAERSGGYSENVSAVAAQAAKRRRSATASETLESVRSGA